MSNLDSGLTAEDRRQIAQMGISLEEAERQLSLLRDPPPFAQVLRPARVGDGIVRLDPAEKEALSLRHERAQAAGELEKLVPASGAASRMFKELAAFLDNPRDDRGADAARRFAECLDAFPFGPELRREVSRLGRDVTSPLDLIRTLLEPEGLGYGNKPKGLILFHRYGKGGRTPFEEHLVEAALHVKDRRSRARVHFTVSPEHEDGFRRRLAEQGPLLEREFDARFEVVFSHQERATDTLAVDLDGRPFRRGDGSLLFRPGGHGALIHNLSRSRTGVVFIKNIDNVVPDHHRDATVEWKKLLGGLLLRLQDRIFAFGRALDSGDVGDEFEKECRLFLGKWFGRRLPSGRAVSRSVLETALHRPLRVCGVVRNTGEPGGGPFWVRDESGEVSCQIVESSQLDHGSSLVREALKAATHFNPVDLVCGLRDWRGRPHDLQAFIDPSAVFVSRKSWKGRELIALERPGLWNGAMAGWNTVMVEVPAETFAPVKTVFDLLRSEHRGEART